MNRRAIVVVMALLLSSCNSTERRWAAFCDEEEAKGWPEPNEESICKNGEYATEQEKKLLLDMRDARNAARERVKATEEEGRRKGYVE